MPKVQARFFSKDTLSSSTTRIIGVVLAAALLAVLDFNAERILLDPASIYPFLIILIAPASLGVRFGIQTIYFIRKACVPIGIFVCIVNSLILLSEMDDVAGLLYDTRLTYAPLALGVMLSFLLSIIETEQKHSSKLDGTLWSFFALLTVLTVALAVFLLFQIRQAQFHVGLFLEDRVFIGSILIYSLYSIHPKMATFSPIQKLYKSSRTIILVSVIIGVAYYVYGFAIDFGDKSPLPDQTTRALSFAIKGMYVGSFIAIISITTGGSLGESDHDSMTFDWHIVEAYTFFLLIVMPPLSILEIASMMVEGID